MLKRRPTRRHCSPEPSRPSSRGAFLRLCGSPIRVQGTPNWNELDSEVITQFAALMTPSTPQTPPLPAPSAPIQTPKTPSRSAVEALSLEGAQTARIPWFMSDWFEAAPNPPADPKQVPKPSRRSINMKDITFGTVIGEGAFGRVYAARWRGKRVAVKILSRQNFTDEVTREFETEVRIMSLLRHPNVCRLLGACLEPPQRALVVELVSRGALWDVLRSYQPALLRELRDRFVLDIARGMRYLHSFDRPILHRDMKSPNLLVDRSFAVKIADFGLARVKAQVQTMTGNCGTVQWMAPEVLGNHKYTEKADVYSFGIVVWEIFTGQCPYGEQNQIQTAIGVLERDLRPGIPRACPAFYEQLMRRCWDRDPASRPAFEEIVDLLESEPPV